MKDLNTTVRFFAAGINEVCTRKFGTQVLVDFIIKCEMIPFLAPHLSIWIDVAITIIPMIVPLERY